MDFLKRSFQHHGFILVECKPLDKWHCFFGSFILDINQIVSIGLFAKWEHFVKFSSVVFKR